MRFKNIAQGIGGSSLRLKKRSPGALVTVVSTFVLATALSVSSLPPAQAQTGPDLHHAADQLARSYGASLNHSQWNSSAKTVFGLGSGAYHASDSSREDPFGARSNVNTLATIVNSATGYNPRTPFGRANIEKKVRLLDVALGKTHTTKYQPARSVFYRLQWTEVNQRDELRRKLLVSCQACVRAAVLTAALNSGSLIDIALNGVRLTDLAKTGIKLTASAVITVMLIAVTEWGDLDLNRANNHTRDLIARTARFLIEVIGGVMNHEFSRIGNRERPVADIENQLSHVVRPHFGEL